MELSIFAKRRRTQDGKIFFTYLTTATKKDGTEVPCSVRFTEPAQPPKPENCPCNIIVNKEHCNMSKKKIFREATGEILEVHTLWISQYAGGSEYVDHSMDEFED